MSKTLNNLQVLKDAQTLLKAKCKEKYEERVQPFIDIIEMVSRNRQVNEFEALPIIQTLSIYEREGAELFFGAALMEIVEVKNLKGVTKN